MVCVGQCVVHGVILVCYVVVVMMVSFSTAIRVCVGRMGAS